MFPELWVQAAIRGAGSLAAAVYRIASSSLSKLTLISHSRIKINIHIFRLQLLHVAQFRMPFSLSTLTRSSAAVVVVRPSQALLILF